MGQSGQSLATKALHCHELRNDFMDIGCNTVYRQSHDIVRKLIEQKGRKSIKRMLDELNMKHPG